MLIVILHRVIIVIILAHWVSFWKLILLSVILLIAILPIGILVNVILLSGTMWSFCQVSLYQMS